MKRFAISSIALLTFIGVATAQVIPPSPAPGVRQSGTVTPGDTACWVASGVIGDTGCGGGASGLTIGTSPITSGTDGYILSQSGGKVAETATGTAAGQLVVGGAIVAAGPTGGSTSIPVITYNAAGQLTTVTTATPSVAASSGISGLGTGVATGLGANVNGTNGFTTYGTDLPLAGGTMTGEMVTKASAAVAGSGFNVPHGVSPNAPANGDLWTTTAGLYAYINSSTVGPFAQLGANIYTGKQTTAASTALGGAGFNLPNGVAPNTPAAGDIWSTTTGFFGYTGAATEQFLYSGGNAGTPSALVGTNISGTAANLTAGNADKYQGETFALGAQSAAVASAGGASSHSYAPGDTITLTGGTETANGVMTVATTQATQGTSWGITNPGASCAGSSATLSGTTGVGTPFQVTATVSGGSITAITGVSVHGSYTTNPTVLTAEPVTGDSCVGVTLSIIMSAATVDVTTPGSYTVPPSNPVAQGASSGSGTGATFNLAMAPIPSIATTTAFGGVTPDGTTISNSRGAISLNLGNANTWTAGQTFTDGDLRLQGSSSGVMTLHAPAVASTYDMTFPAAADTVAVLGLADQTLSGGANLTSHGYSTGDVTVDCGNNPSQYIVNGGAYTITAPTNDGQTILHVRNNGNAGPTTFSGFTVGTNTGDALDTTNGSIFSIFIERWTDATGSVASYSISKRN